MTEFVKIKEGKAEILFPNENQVFYNPVQEFNRDISTAVIRTWANLVRKEQSVKKNALNSDEIQFTMLEALSASGLRSIRYAKEMPSIIKYILANDLSPDAVESIKRNVLHNELSVDKVIPNLGDACSVMYQHREPTKQFDIVDLDPYGTASPFIDGAIQCIKDGGLLCVTCTDMAVLAGKYPETCYAKYGGVPLRTDFCHEMALRLLLQSLNTTAAKYKRYIVPLISYSVDFYIRVFVRVFTSPLEVKRCFAKSALVYQCVGCHSIHESNLGRIVTNGNSVKHLPGRLSIGSDCEYCGSAFAVGGPWYSDPIHLPTFVSDLLSHLKDSTSSTLYKTHQRMIGITTMISEELNDVPYYYDLASLGKLFRTDTPPISLFNSALLNLGYRVSSTHCSPNTVKTDASLDDIWSVMRAWVVKAKMEGKPLKQATEKGLARTSPGYRILFNWKSEGKFNDIENGEIENAEELEKRLMETIGNISFEHHPNADAKSRKTMVRYENHKGMNWGPKAKAKSQNNRSGEEIDVMKSQNKRPVPEEFDNNN